MEIVYFSNVSENTKRFVEKLDIPAQRIPLRSGDQPLHVEAPYILIVPTYGGGAEGGAIPRQVVTFLNDHNNRSLLRGVIAAGNTNFGSTYCLAGRIISHKTGWPLLYRFELLGTEKDVRAVKSILQNHPTLEYTS